jgi:hypothetical protein
VTTIEESKDLEEIKIEELVGSLQTYVLSLPSVKKLKTIALKASKKKVEASSEDDSEEDEKIVAMLGKLPEKMNQRKKKRRIPEGSDALNAQVLGISEPIAGILRRARGRHTM